MATPQKTTIIPDVLSGLQPIELDAAPSENYQGDVEVTEHAVENGAPISDHARAKAEKVTVEGVMTDNPLDGPAVVGRAREYFDRLIALKDARQVLTLLTPRRRYENMVLESLTSQNTARTGAALRFTAAFKQVRTATVSVKLVRVQAEFRANEKNKLGTQVTKSATVKDESTLHSTGIGSRLPKPSKNPPSHRFNGT